MDAASQRTDAVVVSKPATTAVAESNERTDPHKQESMNVVAGR